MLDEHASQPLLLQLANGTLGGDDAGELFGHLAHCAPCRTRLEALRTLRDDAGGAWVSRRRALCFALRLVVDRARQIAAITADRDGGSGVAGGLFTLAPAPLPRGIADSTPAAKISGATPRVEMSVRGPGIGSATVVADARRNAISILLYPIAGQSAAELRETRHPRATLRAPEGDPVHRAPFELVEGAAYLLAEFEQLAQADWTLGLELDA